MGSCPPFMAFSVGQIALACFGVVTSSERTEIFLVFSFFFY